MTWCSRDEQKGAERSSKFTAEYLNCHSLESEPRSKASGRCSTGLRVVSALRTTTDGLYFGGYHPTALAVLKESRESLSQDSRPSHRPLFAAFKLAPSVRAFTVNVIALIMNIPLSAAASPVQVIFEEAHAALLRSYWSGKQMATPEGKRRRPWFPKLNKPRHRAGLYRHE